MPDNATIENLRRWIGGTETVTDVITEAVVTRFRATLQGLVTDEAALPPGIHWCVALPAPNAGELGDDGHAAKGAFLPPVPLPRRMWVASDVRFGDALCVGEPVTRASTIADVLPKQSATAGSLVFVTIEHVFEQAGLAKIRETQTLVYRDSPTHPAPTKVDIAPAPRVKGTSTVITPTNTLLFRYSALTFNAHRIHYDQAYAKREEGYPELVVQGPLMATLLANFAARQRPGCALETFRFRGVAPAFANTALELIAVDDALDRLEIRAPDGSVIMEASAGFSQ